MEQFIEKRLKVKRVEDLLLGNFDINKEGFRHIKSVGIFSSQSPTGARINGLTFEEYLNQKGISLEDWNEKSMRVARKDLQKYRFRVVDGLYGGHEKSFIVFNIERAELERLSRKFYQESYMFINLVDKVNKDIGSGLHFGTDANGNTTSPLTRRGSNNEAKDNVAYMETWARSSENLDSNGNNIDNPYTLMETSFGISIDNSYMKDPSNPSEENTNSYQTRVNSNLGFSAKYKAYGDSPSDFTGSPMNLQPKNESLDYSPIFQKIYENANIEYKRGWQIERNKNNPKALHQLFSNDKIIHGIGADLNIGMAESLETAYDFARIFNETHSEEEKIKFEEARMSKYEILETFKQFLFHGDTDSVPPQLVDAINSVILNGYLNC
jgi:hypothetical protein